VVQW